MSGVMSAPVLPDKPTGRTERGVREGGVGGSTRRGHDREIVRLALPAFGALIAEPLYLLADTAIVGHLGTHQLGGIAIAAIVLTATFGIFNFLAYTTTGTVARHLGAEDPHAAAEHGLDGIVLAAGLVVGVLKGLAGLGGEAKHVGVRGAVWPAAWVVRVSIWVSTAMSVSQTLAMPAGREPSTWARSSQVARTSMEMSDGRIRGFATAGLSSPWEAV